VLGYLSDTRFASGLARWKSGSYNKCAIADALNEKGIASTAAKNARAALWRRRFGQPPKDDKEKARQVRFLLVRGMRWASHIARCRCERRRRRLISTDAQ